MNEKLKNQAKSRISGYQRTSASALAEMIVAAENMDPHRFGMAAADYRNATRKVAELARAYAVLLYPGKFPD